jgi:thiol-disulfide isomerase/thioredoxin
VTPGRREALILGAAGLAAAGAGFLIGPMVIGSNPDGRIWDAALSDLQSNPRRLSEWRGKILVCNFWATWCTPCIDEIPLLMASRAKHQGSNLEVIGIALDQAAKVQAFAHQLSVTYPILLAGPGGVDLLKEAGNPSGGLPFTMIADRRGHWAERKLGAFKGAELETLLERLLRG